MSLHNNNYQKTFSVYNYSFCFIYFSITLEGIRPSAERSLLKVAPEPN